MHCRYMAFAKIIIKLLPFSLDLDIFLKRLSGKINQVLCSLESCSNLFAAYSKQIIAIHMNNVDQSNKLSSVLYLNQSAESSDKGKYTNYYKYVFINILT